jgi:diguanylate cyclase (GGDEF)-like protein
MENINQTENNQESPEEKISRLEKEIKILKDNYAILDDAHEELLNQLTEVEQNAYFDSLTGLRRRDFFIQEISDYLNVTQKPHSSEVEHRENKTEIPVISLVIFDIDKFKNVNDTLGHNIGDVVLKEVAETINKYTREKDITARWGGEEMVLAMIGADENAATAKADFIREKISQIEFPDLPDFKVTISAGVASSDEFNEFNDLFEAADKALYKSKDSGRNKVTAHSTFPN